MLERAQLLGRVILLHDEVVALQAKHRIAVGVFDDDV
jgi:hypothetical protein